MALESKYKYRAAPSQNLPSGRKGKYGSYTWPFKSLKHRFEIESVAE